ncbi:hypothetical protein [Pelagibacterium sediminicola]|uniref:hypothetical protein n=1 Tax=Pelagibacterium sediminicola TaxID=2248761 RepID=UPI001300BC41|nr:hypothetical protein [Pelagibacterium sediminicola]
MRFFQIAAVAVVFFCTVVPASAEQISRCVLEVYSATFLDEPCNFASGPDGSFTMGVGNTEEDVSLYFVYLNVDEDDPNAAFAYWNGFPPENRAHDQLGALEREGACWVNEFVRVCAYR